MTPHETLHILLAEDDDDIRLMTRRVLEKRGFTVTAVADGKAAWQAMTGPTDPPIDVAVVDVMMPGVDGVTLTRRLREVSDLPVIMLTARDHPIDQVQGFDAGCDDYVTKPFHSDVLTSRILAVMRRARTTPRVAPSVAEWCKGDLTVDISGMTVMKNGDDVDLTATEFRLLEAFIQHEGNVLARDAILETVWGSSTGFEPRIVDVNIQRLRTKIGPEWITTVRGAGYKFRQP